MKLQTNYIVIAFSKVIGEIIGSFFLMFFLCAISMGDYLDNGHMNLVEHGLMGGFSIMVIIFSIGHISGSHVNPSVTLGFASIGKFPWIQVIIYTQSFVTIDKYGLKKLKPNNVYESMDSLLPFNFFKFELQERTHYCGITKMGT